MVNSFIDAYGNAFSTIGVLFSIIALSRNEFIRRKNLIREVTSWYFEKCNTDNIGWQEICKQIELKLIRSGYNRRVVGYHHITKEIYACNQRLSKFTKLIPVPTLPERDRWQDYKNCRIWTVFYDTLKTVYVLAALALLYVFVQFTLNEEELDIIPLVNLTNLVWLIFIIVLYPIIAYITLAFSIRDSLAGKYNIEDPANKLLSLWSTQIFAENSHTHESFRLSATQYSGYTKKYVDSFPGLLKGDFFGQRMYHYYQWKAVILQNPLNTVWIKYLITKKSIVNGSVFFDTLDISIAMGSKPTTNFTFIISVEDSDQNNEDQQKLASQIIHSQKENFIVSNAYIQVMITPEYNIKYIINKQ